MLLLIRAEGLQRHAGLLEAAIVTCAFALFQWVWVVQKIVDGSGSGVERAVNAGYPSMDIVLLAGLAGFFVTAAWRTPAFLLLVASITTLLVSDEIYGSTTYHAGDLTDLGWLLSYILAYWRPPDRLRGECDHDSRRPEALRDPASTRVFARR